MNKKLLATMAIALFLVSTLSVLNLVPAVRAQEGECAVCGDVTIAIEPTTCLAKGGKVTITVTAPIEYSDFNATTHNYTLTVTKPTGGSKTKSFSLGCGESQSYVYGTDFGTTTSNAGTYEVKVWEKYFNTTLHAWCLCKVGEDSFAVEAELLVDVYVHNCTPWGAEGYSFARCEDVGYVEAYVQYCNGTAMDDVDATVIATLTPPTGGVAKSAPMYWVGNLDDEWGVWQTNNTKVQECLYTFEWDDCSGNWTVGVTAKDTKGNNGYGANQLTLSPTTLSVDEFYVGYYPDCDTDNKPVTVVGYNSTMQECFWNVSYIFTRCETVFFAAKVGNACLGGLLEEGNVVVTLYTYPYNKTLAAPYLNFSETPTELYTISLKYQGDEDEDWYQYWTANWTVPANATPVGYPSASWWLVNKESRRETWWWANLTAADEACGDPNEGTSTGWNFTEPEVCAMDSVNGMGLLPMWVSYNTPDILIVNPEEDDNFQRCETINFTVKVRYRCCNTPLKAADGGNVSAVLMAECDEEALLETIYLNDTGTHDKDGYEIWKGSYWINVTDPALWVDKEEEIGLNWTILFRASDEAPEPVNEKTETTTITVGPAEADVKACAWIDPNIVSEEGGKGFLFVCTKAWVCGKPVNVTEEGTFATVEISRADTGESIALFDSRLPEDDPLHLWNESETMSWCMNFCVACIAKESPELLGLWNVTVTVNQTGVCAMNTGDRTVQVPAAYVNEITWINMACPVNPSSSVEDNCSNNIYINQTTTATAYHGILSFNATVIDGNLEAKSVKSSIYDKDDVLVWSGLMTNASNTEDEDQVNYTAAFPTTECLAPGDYIVRTELTYENGTSDDACCAYTKPGCPACVIKCPALPEDMECLDTGKCPNNKILEQDGCNFTVVPEIKLASLTTLAGPYYPNGWVRFDGLVNDACGDPLEGVCIEITIKDSDGATFGKLTGESDEDGKVLNVEGGLLELILPQNAKLGNYTWKATLTWPDSEEGCPEEAVYKYKDANDTKFEFSVEQVDQEGSFNVYGKLTTMVILSSNIVYNGSSVDVIINVQDLFAGTPTTATVSGEVTKPDGTTDALTFTPIGTGIYRATYLVPSTAVAGTYTVSYVLSKPLYTGVTGSTAFSVQLKTPLPTTTIPGTTTTATTTITPADITGLLYAIAAIAAIAMIAAIVAVVIIARKTR